MNGAENIPLIFVVVGVALFFLLFAFFFDFRFYLLQARDLPNDVGSKERKNGIEKVIIVFGFPWTIRLYSVGFVLASSLPTFV